MEDKINYSYPYILTIEGAKALEEFRRLDWDAFRAMYGEDEADHISTLEGILELGEEEGDQGIVEGLLDEYWCKVGKDGFDIEGEKAFERYVIETLTKLNWIEPKDY